MATTIGASKPGFIPKPKKDEKKPFFNDKRKKDENKEKEPDTAEE